MRFNNIGPLFLPEKKLTGKKINRYIIVKMMRSESKICFEVCVDVLSLMYKNNVFY